MTKRIENHYIASALGSFFLPFSAYRENFRMVLSESLVRPVVWELKLYHRMKEILLLEAGLIDGRNFDVTSVWGTGVGVW